jgi:uncharacterized protein YlxW (UPF0749 family)
MLRSRSTRTALVVGVLVVVITAVAVIQIRTQVEVTRSLGSVDAASLAFQIHDLDMSNAALTGEAGDLQRRRDALRSGGSPAAAADLQAETSRLRIVDGMAPAQGPGVVVTVDAPLTATDVEDAVNELRMAGAEAITVAGRRVITGSVYLQAPDGVGIDGITTHGPWRFEAIGDPVTLSAAAVDMTRSLRSDRRVRSSSYSTESELVISAVVRPRPFVYGVPQ